jgi:branched-chain amino acid transport system substrate-binding protein
VSGIVSAPIIGGQWKQNVSKWPIDFVICENSSDTNVPVASTLQPYQG